MQQNLLTNREIAVFTSQVELILHAGISPYEGIMIMNEDQDDEKMKVILTTIEDELSVGKPFYEALETSKVFPDYLLNMVKIRKYNDWFFTNGITARYDTFHLFVCIHWYSCCDNYMCFLFIKKFSWQKKTLSFLNTFLWST